MRPHACLPPASAAVVFTILACIAAACGGGTSSGGSSSDGTEHVTGSERLGWTQSAPSLNELNAYDYFGYVDGTRVAMAKASCSAIDSQSYSCSAPLPQMSIGRHTLELSASLAGLEGAKSAPLVLTVGSAIQAYVGQTLGSGESVGRTNSVGQTPGSGVGALAVPAPPRPRACFGSDDCYSVERVSSSLADPHALAVIPDGRIIVAEGDARLVTYGDGGASDWQIDSPCDASSRSRINTIAVDPAFAESRLVFVAWSCVTVGLPRELLVVRYREVNNTLGEAASVFRESGVADSDAFIAVTKTARLIIASRQAERWAIARVTTDGRVPPESANASPVLLQRQSVTALTTDANGGRVMFGTGDGRLETLGAACTSSELGEPVAALGVPPDGESILLAQEPNRGLIKRLRISSEGCVGTEPSSTDLDLRTSISGMAVGPDGSIVVLTRSERSSTVYGSTGSLLRLRPSTPQ